LVRRKLGLSSNLPAPSQEISFSVQDKNLREATILSQKISKLARLGLHRREDIMPLMDRVLRVTTNLIRNNNFQHALKLASSAKLLLNPVLNLDLLRAQAFLGLKEHLSAQEALKEELRFFPNNDEARDLLAQLSRWSHEDVSCFPIEFQKLFDAVRPYTMLSSERLHSLYDLAKKICAQDVPGNFVECGVAAGGSSALISFVIKKYSKRPRILYCFDTFGGMPEPTENDTHAKTHANETGWGTGTCAAREDSLLEVCTNLDTTDIVRPIKGLFKDTLPQYSKEIADVAFLHMDGDWYESTRDIINNLYDQITSEGLIQVDDYGHWDGCKKALHEFEAKKQLHFDLQRIDATGVWFQKPKSTNKIPNNNIKLLNLGCGYRFHPTWTNVDFKSTGPEVITHDIGKGLPFESKSFDAVYHSHLLEHFPKNHVSKFLSECLRVLKPGGTLRVVVPDLETIARLYLLLMEKSLNGDEEAQKRYEWIMLELFDQMVRNTSGGAMLDYWRQDPMMAEDFVIQRLGSEAKDAIATIRTAPDAHIQQSSKPDHPLDPYKTGQFRLSGEVHQWMYDRYSLGKLLQEAGFEDIRVCRADESSIPDFNVYLLDIETNGSIRKPDSLFMEAVKP
jgi:predicted SAM-dependent methyltransferase